jgi:hypothetical protein
MASRTIELDAELLAKACDAMTPTSVRDAEIVERALRRGERRGGCVIRVGIDASVYVAVLNIVAPKHLIESRNANRPR